MLPASQKLVSAQPPDTFIEDMSIPVEAPRTALGMGNTRLRKVPVTFYLTGHDGSAATYEAQCPRCLEGVIKADARLKPDGSFAEHPACPSLCEACEERLDAILEGGGKSTYEFANRVVLKNRVVKRR